MPRTQPMSGDGRERSTRSLTAVEVTPAGESMSYLCTADGVWHRIPMAADHLCAQLERLDGVVPETDGAPSPTPEGPPTEVDRLAAILEAGGSRLGSFARPAASASVEIVGDPALAARLERFDSTGLFTGTRSGQAADTGAAAQGRLRIVAVTGAQSHIPVGDADESDPNLPLLVVRLTDCAFSFGPMATVGELAGRDPVAVRLRANARFPGAVSGPRTRRLGRQVPDDPELAVAVAVLVLDVHRFLEGEPYLCDGHEVLVRPSTMSVSRHRVLPLPFGSRPDSGRQQSMQISPDDLIDPRTGVILELRRDNPHPSTPPSFITVKARVANMRRVSPWFTDPVAAGTSFDAVGAAREAAIGEAVERYCGGIVQVDRLREATWRELCAAGELAVDPESLVLFSDEQYRAPGFPFVPFTRDLSVHWYPGRSLTTGAEAWLPANLLYSNWYTGGFEDGPHLNNVFYPGLAAGPDLDFAIAAGIQEIIERHATMVWWANAQPLPAVEQTAMMKSLWAGGPEQYGQRAWLVHLDNEFDVPVFAGMLRNTDETLFTIGFAARPDPEGAALKAWAEAITLQDGCRDLLDPKGAYRKAATRGDVNATLIKPWRADRRYLDDYRPDFRDVVDLWGQLQANLDPRAFERVRKFVDTPVRRTFDDLPRLADGSRQNYQRVVEDKGYEIFYADLTTRDVAQTDMRVVRVLIPGLVANFAAGFPFLGKGRISTAAVDLGWRSAPLAGHEVNVFPMAHA